MSKHRKLTSIKKVPSKIERKRIQPTIELLWKPLPQAAKSAFWVVSAIFSLLGGAYFFVPWVKIESTSTIIDLSDPYSTQFQITNQSVLSLNGVEVGCSNPLTHYPSDTIYGNPDAIVQARGASNFEITPSNIHTFTCVNMLNLSRDGKNIKASRIRLVISARFSVLRIPIFIKREQKFDSRLDSNGRLQWRPVAAFDPPQPDFK